MSATCHKCGTVYVVVGQYDGDRVTPWHVHTAERCNAALLKRITELQETGSALELRNQQLAAVCNAGFETAKQPDYQIVEYDLPSLKAENERLKAENEELRRGEQNALKTLDLANEVLCFAKAENERLQSELRNRGILLRGWTCTCGVFNGEEKEERSTCRSCNKYKFPNCDDGTCGRSVCRTCKESGGVLRVTRTQSELQAKSFAEGNLAIDRQEDSRRTMEKGQRCFSTNHDGRQCEKPLGHEGEHYEPGCNYGWSTVIEVKYCICGVCPGGAYAVDERAAWRHRSFCPHAGGKVTP